MTTLEHNIDLNMYSFFINDATQHLGQLNSALNSITKDACINQDIINHCINALKAIGSGAKLCKIPYVSDFTQTISDDIKILAKNESSEKCAPQLESIDNKIKLIDELTRISDKMISQWLDENSSRFNYSSAAEKNTLPTKNTSEVKPPPVEATIVESSIDHGMLELFKLESETQANVINANLLKLENEPDNGAIIEPLMRAAHSIKGAARMIGLDIIVNLAHLMEECFVNTQKGTVTLTRSSIDLLLHCNDILGAIPKLSTTDIPAWLNDKSDDINSCLPLLDDLSNNLDIDTKSITSIHDSLENETSIQSTEIKRNKDPHDNSIRIQSTQLNKMLAISNELLVSQHWLQEHQHSLLRLKKQQTNLAGRFQKLKQELDDIEISDEIFSILLETDNAIEQCRNSLAEDISQVDEFDRKSLVLSSRLNQEVTACRMRPFRECTVGFERMVRDVSHNLDKKVHLDINGLDTLVDSDILDSIEAPLTHLLRNAIDHGIELPLIRTSHNKPEHGTIKLHAYHNSGKLNITITDDGQGIDLENLKNKIIKKGLINQEMANKLSESELLDFLFLPGFSTKDNVTEISGRGVGLDIVHSVVTNLRGLIRCSSQTGQGMNVTLQLPLTLSVIHTLMTEINKDYYAFPLARIHTVIKVPKETLFTIEQKQFIKFSNQNISVIHMAQILGFTAIDQPENDYHNMIILVERGEHYALVVDKLINEEKLALHQISPMLGKIKDISATALADDGKVVLVLDVDDILIHIQEIIGGNQLQKVSSTQTSQIGAKIRKVLVVDDSLTVREVEKNLLESKGYDVDIAVDGIDGWNTIRQNDYDLVITDIDMPRMNGIELVLQIKSEPRLQSIPVMIVSYKDNPDDRQRGLEAGADYYLTKGSFHDDTLIEAVLDLIGEAAQ